MYFIYSVKKLVIVCIHFSPINLCVIITLCVNDRYIINLTIYCYQFCLKSKVSFRDINKRKSVCIFTQVITISGALHSLIYIPIFIWHHFSSARRSAFKISCCVSMLMINSLAFVCLGKFLFTSIFEGLFMQIEF